MQSREDLGGSVTASEPLARVVPAYLDKNQCERGSSTPTFRPIPLGHWHPRPGCQVTTACSYFGSALQVVRIQLRVGGGSGEILGKGVCQRPAPYGFGFRSIRALPHWHAHGLKYQPLTRRLVLSALTPEHGASLVHE